jgi:glycine/D-amino acid oxidase-like deaminating enzyme
MPQPIEQACFWLAARRGYTPNPSLREDLKADVVIIGGGFTGLWTSIFLKQLAPAIDVVVLEQAMVGYGGSGRNAGQVSSSIDHTHSLAIAHYGVDEARRMSRVGLQNIEEFQRFIREHNIDCNFEQTGQLAVALTPAQVTDAHDLVAAAEKLEVTGVRFLSADETRAELNSPLYLAGVSDPGWGIVDPVKLVDGLKRETERLGVKIFEHTRVRGFERTTATVRVQTSAGMVSADQIILAADAYTHHLFPQLLRRFIPLYDYVLASEPLTPAQLAAIGWPHRQAVVDFRTFFNYYRLTADNRILWGTSEAMYYPPNRRAITPSNITRRCARVLFVIFRRSPI